MITAHEKSQAKIDALIEEIVAEKEKQALNIAVLREQGDAAFEAVTNGERFRISCGYWDDAEWIHVAFARYSEKDKKKLPKEYRTLTNRLQADIMALRCEKNSWTVVRD